MTMIHIDAASPPPVGEGIVSIWLAKAAASGVQQADENSAVSNAGDTGENLTMAPQPSQPQDVWSIVCSTCSKPQVESCLLSAFMDAPSRTYDPSAAIFQAADTYDCLVNTDGCCAELEVEIPTISLEQELDPTNNTTTGSNIDSTVILPLAAILTLVAIVIWLRRSKQGASRTLSEPLLPMKPTPSMKKAEEPMRIYQNKHHYTESCPSPVNARSA
jgi:hypothetical protein